MAIVFKIVYLWLMGLVWLTGLSYNEINIIVFYFLIPVSWIFLFELPRKKFNFTIGIISLIIVGVFFISISSRFKGFSDWLFIKSQDFLNAIPFTRDEDYNYIVSSVVTCVIVPVLIYIPLLKRNWDVIKNNWKYIILTFIILNLLIGYGVFKLMISQ